jgi:hypothetical protein
LDRGKKKRQNLDFNHIAEGVLSPEIGDHRGEKGKANRGEGYVGHPPFLSPMLDSSVLMV